MLKKLLCTFGILLSTTLMVFAQNSSIQGTVTEKENPGESIPSANVILTLDGKQISQTITDIDGKYAFRALEAGSYTIKITSMGMTPIIMSAVELRSGQSLIKDFQMEPDVKQTGPIIITGEKPVIEIGVTQVGATLSGDDLKKMPGRDVSSFVATMAGVGVGADGGQGAIRGMRSDGQVYMVDGIKMQGTSSVPKGAISELQLMVGGIPAKYGEATAGVISIMTKGASRTFGGSAELMTTEPFDRTNNNLLGFSLTGPIIKGKSKSKDEPALFGFFLSGEAGMSTSPTPRYDDFYRVKSDVKANLEQNPYILRQESNGAYNLKPATDYLRQEDFETFRYFTNAWNYNFKLAGKLDVRTSKSTNLTFGGQFNYGRNRNNGYGNQVLNAENASESVSRVSRIYGRFIHRIPDTSSNSLIKNVYYQISGGFTNSYSSTYSPEFGDDIFKYGHVGNYTTHSTPTFAPSSVWVKDKQTGDSVYYANAWVLTDWTYDTLVTYKPSTYNPGIAQWMQQYYSFFPVTNTPNGFYNSYEMLNLYGAILNGGGVPGSYTDASGNLLFSNVNAPQSTSYGYGNTNFFDFRIDVSGDIKGHQIELGINYDQRVSRSYNIGAYSLWTLMRQLQNRHIGQLDLANGWVVPGSQMDTVYYGLKDDGSQSTFDKNLREKLGMTNTTGIYTNKDWLDIDSYDPSTFSLNMFSVEDLLNSGNPVVGYAGYDAWGKKTKGQASFDDFFKTGSSRTISAASPVMMSGYIQDKFVFEDLIFQVGLRLDRYDNNTWVMKDPYLMYDAKTVGQVGGTHPGNIGNDYVVYVDDPTQANPTIMGYRSGSTWYNKNGIQIDDSELKTISGGSGEPTPYLSDPNVIRTKEKNFNAFKDYEPQTTLSPRLAFSFPISDEAVFIAHYDVMTKRPTNNAFPYMSYLYMEDKYTSAVLTNPDLKFERNTDYEVGFQQALGKEKIAALKFTAYYKEVRDLIQVSVVSGAYPKTYYTYSNLDFLTIKGLSLTYDLRRVKNIAMSANYTLQFANGTGSDPTSQLSFVQNGYPNLRTLSPLSTDQRHMIKVDLDFRYFDGKDYNGPIIRRKVTEGGVEKVKEYRIFTNSGIHLTGQAVSGTPYTKRVGAVDRLIKSDINNATNPWQFYVNARIDKNFPFLLGKEGGKRRFANLEAYVEIMNLLNIRNIPSVDAVTGNYNDDGRLEDPKFQPTINAQADPVSYVQMYQMFVNDSPYNIALPIRARLGFIFSF